MAQTLDYASNIYLAITLSSSSSYTTYPITLNTYPSITDIGHVGSLPDVKLLSVPKDIWSEASEDILKALNALNDGKENVDVLRVDKQELKSRTKRGGDEL